MIEKKIKTNIQGGSQQYAKGYGRLWGTMSSIVILIDSGLVKDLDAVVEMIESRFRKEKKEDINNEHL